MYLCPHTTVDEHRHPNIIELSCVKKNYYHFKFLLPLNNVRSLLSSQTKTDSRLDLAQGPTATLILSLPGEVEK